MLVETPTLAGLTPLLRDLNDLKRVRAAHYVGSFADRLFADAWRQLLAGEPAAEVAMNVTARAVVATRLAGIDAENLSAHGLDDNEVFCLLQAGFDNAADGVPDALHDPLRAALALQPTRAAGVPAFVNQLLRQPRAGATHPGRPRYLLEPAESHGDHCLAVAVYAVLVSPRFEADPGTAFLCGLAHHLFNASLPDAGFNGDVVLHDAGLLDKVTAAAFALAYRQLPGDLAADVRAALAFTKQVDPPVSRCFHAADVFDRVLEMSWFDRAARFRLADAVVGLDIVHVAPEQSFQRAALSEAGIWSDWPELV